MIFYFIIQLSILTENYMTFKLWSEYIHFDIQRTERRDIFL